MGNSPCDCQWAKDRFNSLCFGYSVGMTASSPPPPGKKTSVRFLVAAALVLSALLILQAKFGSKSAGSGPMRISGSVNADVIAELLRKRGQCQENARRLAALGLVRLTRSNAMTIANYDEAIWTALEHDDKIRQALLIYCADMPESGDYTVVIEGLHDGKSKAHVVGGNYFDD